MSDSQRNSCLELADGAQVQHRVFADDASAAVDFRVDGKTAAVFDDVVGRSVPMYDGIERLSIELANDFAVSGSLPPRSWPLDRDHAEQSRFGTAARRALRGEIA